MIFNFIIAGIVSVNLLSQGNLDLTTMEFTEEGTKIMEQVNFILMLLQEIVLILTTIVAWKKVMKRPLSNMGLTPLKKHWKEFITGLLFGIVSITLVFLALILSGNAIVESWSPTFSLNLLTYLLLYVLVGFAEEIFGRGFVMASLRQTRNLPVVILVSSVIFAILHGANPGINILPLINLTIFGIMLATIYIKSGNLWMCIGYHISWNYFQGNIYGFKVSGTNSGGLISTYYESNNLFNGGDFGPEGGLFVTAILILGFLFVKLYYRNSTFDFIASEPEEKEEFVIQQQ